MDDEIRSHIASTPVRELCDRYNSAMRQSAALEKAAIMTAGAIDALHAALNERYHVLHADEATAMSNEMESDIAKLNTMNRSMRQGSDFVAHRAHEFLDVAAGGAAERVDERAPGP